MKYGPKSSVVGLAALSRLAGRRLSRRTTFSASTCGCCSSCCRLQPLVLLAPDQLRARRSRSDRQSAYMDEPIRYGAIATMFWGVVGLLVGVVIALQLAFPDLNIEPWFNFGRMRPLHTSAVIFAFGGNALIATSFYVVQRTHARPPVRRRSRLVRVLGLPAVHRHGGDRLSARHHPEPRICRARMVRRHLADGRLGRLSGRLPRHDPQAQGTAHLRRQLVLPVLHRDHRDAARRQQSGDAGLVPRLARAIRSSPASRMR